MPGVVLNDDVSDLLEFVYPMQYFHPNVGQHDFLTPQLDLPTRSRFAFMIRSVLVWILSKVDATSVVSSIPKSASAARSVNDSLATALVHKDWDSVSPELSWFDATCLPSLWGCTGSSVVFVMGVGAH